jgi:hypothetical protein
MKKQYLWGAVAVAAVIALWAVSQDNGSVKEIVDNLNPSLDGSRSPSPSGSPSVSGTPTVSAKATVKTTPKVGAAVTYSQLLPQYEGKRIQFDALCQASPRSATFNNNTSIMLDNRSGDARIISVGGVQHSLAGFGYKIVKLSSATLPKTLSINCGAAVNVGTILLQK